MSKKMMYWASFVLVLGLVLTSAANAADPDLVGYWKLDETSGTTAQDATGNGNDGTLNGDPQWVAGRLGGALEFDGVGDYVDIGNDPIFNITGQITVACWIKVSQFTIGWQAIFTMGDDSWRLQRQTTTNTLCWACTGVTGTPGDWWLYGDVNINDGEWHHAAGVYDGSEYYLYVDGDLDASKDTSGTMSISSYPVLIGANAQQSGREFEGLIDDVRVYKRALMDTEILGVMSGGGAEYPRASGPVPADGALHEDTWVTLSWRAGDYAVSHDVYLGENSDDVSNATPDSDVFRGNQITTFYVAGFPGFAFPEGLVPGTTYYWRIDEVNDADPNSPWKGPVWSFSIPPKTAYNPDPADGAEFVDPNAPTLSWTAGYGAKLHTVYLGDDFDEVSNATGGMMVGPTTYSPGPLELEKVYYWRVDEFDAVETHKGDVWTFTTPGAVGNAQPANGATGVAMTTSLSWTPADNATSHQVYLGRDKDAVRRADMSSPEYLASAALGSESIDPGKLAWHTLYYWRVDAVYNAGPVKGPIWSFTTADFIAVDDFESYTDDDVAGEAIWQHWIDGFGVADNGAQAGYLVPPYCEQTIVHSGAQSMPLLYTNEAGVTNSEATLTLTAPRDWTEEGVGELSLWFRGNSANAADPLYVAVSNTAGAPAVVAQEDANAAQTPGWTRWVIPLQAFADQGIDLTNMDKIAIGLGSRSGMAVVGGTGTMFIDDIALYRSEP
jgi:hypothetical protein